MNWIIGNTQKSLLPAPSNSVGEEGFREIEASP
jgi:hypothetical protein